MTEPTPPSGPPAPEPSHHTGTLPAVAGRTGVHTGMIPVVAPPPRPRGATALALIMSMVGTALLMVIVGVIWFGTSGGPAGDRGTWNGPIAYPKGLTTATSHAVTFTDDTVYFRSGSSEDKTWITAVDAETGAEKWSLDEGLDTGSESALTYIDPGRDAILVRTAAGDERSYLVETKTGKAHELSDSEGASMSYRMIGGVPVRTGVDGGLEALDATGGTLWENKETKASPDSLVAVTTSGNQDELPYPGNPINAKRLLSVDYDGTVTIFETTTGDIVTEDKEALDSGSTVLLVLDDTLFAKTNDGDRDVITAYDLKDDYAEIDSWESEKGQNFTSLSPCGDNRVCVGGIWISDYSRLGNAVIDLDEGIVWKAPDDVESSYAYVSFASDTMAVAYYSADYTTDNPTETRLYDKDFEEIGEPIPGWFQAVDDETFASVGEPEEREADLKPYDAQVSTIDAEDGRVARLDSFPAYPGCAIGEAVLACATETGYRLWSYR